MVPPLLSTEGTSSCRGLGSCYCRPMRAANRGVAMFGYHGRYLRIDLGSATSRWLPLPEQVLRRFLGGVGLATYLLHRESRPGLDPLSVEAPLIFSLSPLVG